MIIRIRLFKWPHISSPHAGLRLFSSIQKLLFVWHKRRSKWLEQHAIHVCVFLTDIWSTTRRDNFLEHAFLVSRLQTTFTCTNRSKSVSCWCEFCTEKDPFRSPSLPQWDFQATCLWLYDCYYCLSFSWMPHVVAQDRGEGEGDGGGDGGGPTGS